jgi:hypothetical protein
LRALEWLKLNHVNYNDLDIAYEELDRYPKDVPPVSIEYQHSETNKRPEGTSYLMMETRKVLMKGSVRLSYMD